MFREFLLSIKINSFFLDYYTIMLLWRCVLFRIFSIKHSMFQFMIPFFFIIGLSKILTQESGYFLIGYSYICVLSLIFFCFSSIMIYNFSVILCYDWEDWFLVKFVSSSSSAIKLLPLLIHFCVWYVFIFVTLHLQTLEFKIVVGLFTSYSFKQCQKTFYQLRHFSIPHMCRCRASKCSIYLNIWHDVVGVASCLHNF